MRAAMTPNFRKLWGIAKQNLSPGKYRVVIANLWPVNQFKGEKYVVMS